MNTLNYNPTSHFSASDQAKLEEAARKSGSNVANYIEATLKKAIWNSQPATPLAAPARKKGGKTNG